MKLKIEFTRNTELVPFNYVGNLNGYLHKVLGDKNGYHDSLSLYSSSFLHGGRMSQGKNTNYLEFSRGATWYVSSPDKEFISRFIMNLYNNLDFAFGMKLKNATVVDYKLKDVDRYVFKTKSPVLIKQKDENRKNVYYTFEDDKKVVSDLLNNLMLKKLTSYGIEAADDDFNISLDDSYEKKKIRWIQLKTVGNKTSVCPVIVETSRKDIADFIYNVGVGHSTGAGFGFLL